jgi:diguanylate cyclase (GGDEF)-like protein
MVEPRRRDGIARRMRRGPEGVKDVRVVAGGASLRDSERWTRVGFGAPDACARTVAAPAPDVDRRPLDEPSQIGHLRSFVRSIALAAWVFGGAETALAVASGRPTALVAGGSIVAFGIYLLWFRRRLARRTAAASAHELAGATMVVIVGSGLLQPLHGESLALAALIPVAIALPFVERTAMRRLIVLGWGVGIAGIVGAEAFPNLSGLPPVAITPLRIGAVAIILGLVLLLIEQVWRRLSDAAGELASLAGMSSELTRTLDPLAMGDVIARRIAEAVAADEAGICYWDRDRDALLTYGYYPPADRDDVETIYQLTDYPATRAVLEEARAAVISADDPAADPSELRYLASIGQRALAMLPLVSKGRAIGVLELSASDPDHFAPRRLRVAERLAAEAALALENALLHAELRELAYHDPLTGLANRTLLRQRAEAAIARARSTDEGVVALLYLDLDDLKVVNDTLGHGGGDDLLVAAGERIRASIRPTDLAARLGGDEFAVLLEGLLSEHLAVDIGERIVAALAEPFSIEGVTVTSGASLGVAFAGFSAADPGRTSEELLDRADAAMYRAKRSGKGRVEVAGDADSTGTGTWSSAHDPERVARRAGGTGGPSERVA